MQMAAKKFFPVLKTCVQMKIGLDSFVVFSYSPCILLNSLNSPCSVKEIMEFGKGIDKK